LEIGRTTTRCGTSVPCAARGDSAYFPDFRGPDPDVPPFEKSTAAASDEIGPSRRLKLTAFHDIFMTDIHGSKAGAMATDHFIPRAYLRGFTRQYLGGERGGELVVYNPSSGNFGTLSINNYVGCEPDFYNNHPIDKEWSRTIERTWGNVRDRLKACERSADLLEELFWFVSAQFIRTHSFMERTARQVAWQERKKTRVTLDGREVNGAFMNMASTTSVLDQVQAAWPIARHALETDYVWTVYHNQSGRFFLTSDNPCQLDDRTQKLMMPLALDLAIVGTMVADKETPYVRHSDATAEVIRKINQGVVKNCRSLVYSHEQSEGLRRFVMKHHVFDPSPDSIGRSFTNNPEPMTDEGMKRMVDRFNELRRRDKGRSQQSQP
jgi:hypothetical protein